MSNELKIPSAEVVKEIVRCASTSMNKRLAFNSTYDSFERKICAICDCFVTVENEEKWIPVKELEKYCNKSGASHDYLKEFFPENLLHHYKNNHVLLQAFVISPSFSVRKSRRNIEQILICSECNKAFQIVKEAGKLGRKRDPPMRSIWNGNLIGEAPAELSELTIAELAIVSPNRILSHGIVLYADQHKGVYGWHAMYENNVGLNVCNIEQLIEAGLSREIVCVLCGPFTKSQQMFARNQVKIRYDYIKRAFLWLKDNNHFFKDIRIPAEEEIRSPVILLHDDL